MNNDQHEHQPITPQEVIPVHTTTATGTKALWKREIPVWMFVTIVLALFGALFALSIYAKKTENGYPFLLPDVSFEKEDLDYGSYPVLSNADYFNTVKNKLIDDKASFIDADLSQMLIRVYKDGIMEKEVKILSKGREGSWWETPAGVYKIESKEKNHFSSFGKVYQPWSMAFQGNFFIHGWPYYPNGDPVSSQFSGGCIRLSNEDAEEIYKLVSVGTPVLVYEKDFGSDNFVYETKRPQITAQGYLVADLKNNFVFIEQASKEVMPIASLTKLVTALVAAEYINLDKDITITPQMIVDTSKKRLVSGENVQAFQLLYPLLLESSNEAAEALARSSGLDRFVNLMNKKVAALGMTSTHFVDPAGRGAENVSTAEELFTLAKYIHNNRSFVFKITTGNLQWSAYGSPIYKNLGNFNKFPVSNAEFVGGKVGQTIAAGETAVAVFNVTIRGEKRPVAFVLLQSENVYKDMPLLVNYVMQTYQ